MEVMFTKNLIGSFRPPPLSDMRWRIFMLLFFYLILGMTMLGFSRKPLHILLLIGGGALLDLVLNLLIRKQKIFPLSAMISCCSMAIILNWSFDIYNLFLPLFVCITSKYILYPEDINIHLLFLMYLVNAAVSYLGFAYKGALFEAYQEGSIVHQITAVVEIIKYILQITILIILRNYYWFALMLPLSTICITIVTEKRSRQVHPDLVPRGHVSLENKNN